MEQLAARFPHLVSLKVSNPLLHLGLRDWTQVHVGPSIWSFWCPWRSLILYFTWAFATLWAIGPKCMWGLNKVLASIWSFWGPWRSVIFYFTGDLPTLQSNSWHILRFQKCIHQILSSLIYQVPYEGDWKDVRGSKHGGGHCWSSWRRQQQARHIHRRRDSRKVRLYIVLVTWEELINVSYSC